MRRAPDRHLSQAGHAPHRPVAAPDARRRTTPLRIHPPRTPFAARRSQGTPGLARTRFPEGWHGDPTAGIGLAPSHGHDRRCACRIEAEGGSPAASALAHLEEIMRKSILIAAAAAMLVVASAASAQGRPERIGPSVAFFTPPIGNVDSFVDNTFEASFVSTGTAPIALTIELCALDGVCYVLGLRVRQRAAHARAGMLDRQPRVPTSRSTRNSASARPAAERSTAWGRCASSGRTEPTPRPCRRTVRFPTGRSPSSDAWPAPQASRRMRACEPGSSRRARLGSSRHAASRGVDGRALRAGGNRPAIRRDERAGRRCVRDCRSRTPDPFCDHAVPPGVP